MLIQFAVKNFKSIKEEIVLNFSASDTNEEYVVKKEAHAHPLFHTIGLVGPNASGKSNIIQSVAFSLKFIVNTLERKESDKIGCVPFLLDKNNAKEDTSFEWIFIENDMKYVYGFSINNEIVTKEYLLVYKSKKPTTLFDRDTEREEVYDFKGKNLKIQKEIAKKTNANRLYMAVAAEWGLESCKIPYDWFVRMCRQYDGMDVTDVIGEVAKDEKLKSEMIDILSKADFNISDISIKHRKVDEESKEMMQKFLSIIAKEEILKDNLEDTIPEIWVTHKSGDGNTFKIKYDADSAGTIDLIRILALHIFLKKQGGLILIDEFGRNYHTKLTEYILKQINNSKNETIQMLFCTHETIVLKILKPEQIYLVDKTEDGATFVKLLDDYIIREKDNIELGYLKGRYGAIPYMVN